MAISNLTPVEPWPSRKLPQDRFDASVKTAMDQMSVMVGELNNSFIPAANAASEAITTINPDLPAIRDAPNQAAAAASSAEAAATSAGAAAESVTSAAQEVQKAKDEVVNAKSEADRAKQEADRAQSIAGVGPATVEKVGLIKPDGTTTKTDEFGTLSVPTFGGSAVGLVPAATPEDAKKVLLGNGTWDNTDLAPISEKTQALGNVSGEMVIDLSAGLAISVTITGATTFSLTNPPSVGSTVVVMQLTNGGSATITWPTSIKWAGGTAPKLTAAGIDIIVLTTSDAGVTWYGISNLKYV